MDRKEYRKLMDEVLYLVRCAVNNELPEKPEIEKLDMANLYKVAEKHMLAALVAYALKKAGIYEKDFVQSLGKSIRKVTIMELDKELLFQRFEEEKIWYMPLKGIVVKELYPAAGFRQMSDFDILFDGSRAEDVNEIMLSMGFTCEKFGKSIHNVYYKQPVSNFEMHTALFGNYHDRKLYKYYKNVFDRLEKDKDNDYGYHFNNNDMYIYIVAHEYKHYTEGGTGVRSLLDIYMIWKKLGETLDEKYIARETRKLGIYDFEKKNKILATHLFGGGELTEEEKKMLDYMIYSGVYGNIQNKIKNHVADCGGGKIGKVKFLFKNLFLPMHRVKIYYPLFYKYKVLLPFLPLYRIGRSLTVSREKTKTMLKILKKVK